jgi:hypothetical protein
MPDGESALYHHFVEFGKVDIGLKSVTARDEAVRCYSWAVLSRIALEAIIAASPTGIVEIGAGNGYNAALLAELGADVVAYDIAIPEDRWFDVEVGGPEVLAWHPDRTLLLSWPPYYTSMAAECLARHQGPTLAYVGEGAGGCTAGPEFFDTLSADFGLVRRVSIPNWFGIHDCLEIHQRAC